MGLRELLIDAWSRLNYKQAMADPYRPGQLAFPELNSSWVPVEDLRRLAAYKVLAAYDSNQAGQLAAVTGDGQGVERRELGDPSKLIDTTLGYLLGPEQAIAVPEADQAEQEVRSSTPPSGVTCTMLRSLTAPEGGRYGQGSHGASEGRMASRRVV